jgi:hypothetical protein
MPKNKGDGDQPTLIDLGISKKQSSDAEARLFKERRSA